MKVALVGSRGLSVDISAYIPKETTMIISGGAIGIDTLAERYALSAGIPFQKFLPDYKLYGKRAPLVRNTQIADAADMIVAIWDGYSHGTAFTIRYARKQGKPVRVHVVPCKASL